MGRNLTLLLVLLTALAAGLWLWAGDSPGPQGPVDGTPSPGIGVETSTPGAPSLDGDTGLTPADQSDRDPSTAAYVPPPMPTTRIQVVRASDGTPIAGAHVWHGELDLAGPSGDDGWLEFIPPRGQRVTFWSAGWIPAEFLSRALPAERVELIAADASLEVLLDDLDPGDGALHSHLEPLGWTAPKGAPWSEPLEVTAPNRLLSEGLAPGRYQVYVWVGAYQTSGVPLEPIEVELIAGKHEVVRLDASAKPDKEVDR